MCRPIRSLLLLIIACGTVIAAEPDSEKRKAAAFELSLAYNYVNFIVDYDEALAEIEEALALDPTLADAYRLRAYVHWQQGKLAVALKDADEAIRLGPKQALCYSTRATILAKAGQPKRAIHDYCLALKFDPNRAWDYCGRGMARASLGNYSNAIDDLKSAAEINPKLPDAPLELGRIHATCPITVYRNGPEAIKLAERARELLTRDDYQIFDVLAAANAENGNFPAAVELQQKAVAAAKDAASEADTKELRKRLALYQSGKPYRSSPVVPSATADKK